MQGPCQRPRGRNKARAEALQLHYEREQVTRLLQGCAHRGLRACLREPCYSKVITRMRLVHGGMSAARSVHGMHAGLP